MILFWRPGRGTACLIPVTPRAIRPQMLNRKCRAARMSARSAEADRRHPHQRPRAVVPRRCDDNDAGESVPPSAEKPHDTISSAASKRKEPRRGPGFLRAPSGSAGAGGRAAGPVPGRDQGEEGARPIAQRPDARNAWLLGRHRFGVRLRLVLLRHPAHRRGRGLLGAAIHEHHQVLPGVFLGQAGAGRGGRLGGDGRISGSCDGCSADTIDPRTVPADVAVMMPVPVRPAMEAVARMAEARMAETAAEAAEVNAATAREPPPKPRASADEVEVTSAAAPTAATAAKAKILVC